MNNNFVNLHTHIFSNLDAYGKLEDRIQWCKDNDAHTLCVTDHGTMNGVYQVYKECHKNKIKPLLGIEFYCVDSYDVEDKKTLRKTHHLIGIAKNKGGYELLCELNKIANDNFYYRPILSKEILFNSNKKKLHSVIWTTACVQNDIAKLLIEDKKEEAEKLLLEYDKHLNNEDRNTFYLELQPFPEDGYPEKVLKTYCEWSDKYDIKLSIGTDSHYVSKDDAFFHKIFVINGLSGKKGKTIFDDDFDKYFSTKNLYLYTLDDVYKEFEGLVEKKYLKKAIENNNEIGEKLVRNYTIDHDDAQIPKSIEYKDVEKPDYDRDLAKLCLKKLKKKGLYTQDYINRLKEELSVISPNGYSRYFILLHSIVENARDKYGRYVVSFSGRGSAGGSLVSYLLDITGVDPIKYDLSFARFLNHYRSKKNIINFF